MARRYSVDGRLNDLLIRGARMRGDIADAVLNASLSLSVSEVSQLELTVADDEKFTLLKSGLFAPGTPRAKGSHLRYKDLNFEVRAVEVSDRGADHALKVTARSMGAGNLKRARGALVRRGLSPTQFVALEAKRAGLKFVGQPSGKRKTITRQTGDDAESSWDTCQRLAKELGYVCFESAGVLHFGKPTWLTTRVGAKVLRVPWRGRNTDDSIDRLPKCRRSGDDAKNVATVSAALRGDLGELARPGMALVLDGVPMFEGRYFVDSVSFNLAEGEAVAVDASTAIDPKPEPPESKTKKSGTSSEGGASKTVTKFVALALEQAGDRYIFGAEASASDPDPNAFDCSELVEWALARAGVTFVDGSQAQIDRCKPISVTEGIRTKGALLWHPGHIAISLGNGQTIEAANSRVGVVKMSARGRFTRAGLVPGLKY